MAVTVARPGARDVIVCPGCGSRRVVTDRSVRRAAQMGGSPCATCRGQSPVRQSRDSDLRFWLQAFGARVPKGMSPREFITAGGAPRELVDLAHQCNPDV